MTDEIYSFPAQVTNIVDGDTLDTRLDLGFEIYTIERVRLAEIDTAEVYGVDEDSKEYERGMQHSQAVKQWVQEARSNHDGEWSFVLHTEEYERGAYGRVIGRLEAKHTGYLATHLKEEFDDIG